MPEPENTHSPDSLPLAPHQSEFVAEIMRIPMPARVFLNAPPGAGKTVAIAAAVGAIIRRKPGSRCLIIAPSPLIMMWQDQLRAFGKVNAVAMTPQEYRRLQAETAKEENIWSALTIVIASIDFLKAHQRFLEILTIDWDLVIIDEAHRYSRSSQRGDVAKELWHSKRVSIAIAATSTPAELDWLPADSPPRQIVWNYAALMGGNALPERKIHVVTYSLSSTEMRIFGRVDEAVRNLTGTPEATLIANLLRRRLSSSIYAFEQSLRRLLARMTAADSEEVREDDEIEISGEPAFSAFTTERLHREAGEQLLELLETERSDSKWNCCQKLLDTSGMGRVKSAILVTDFADTALYLDYLAKADGFRTSVITGGSSLAEREQGWEEAKASPSLVICTTAAAANPFPLANEIVHYDLPSVPRVLQERFATLERPFTSFGAFHHYFIVSREIAADAVVIRLLQKTQAIEHAWGRPLTSLAPEIYELADPIDSNVGSDN